jgi:hypothetical protein
MPPIVTLYAAQQYYFPIAGTHDACDRWLTHHRDLTLELPGAPATAGTKPTTAVTPAAGHTVPPGDLDYQVDPSMQKY